MGYDRNLVMSSSSNCSSFPVRMRYWAGHEFDAHNMCATYCWENRKLVIYIMELYQWALVQYVLPS